MARARLADVSFEQIMAEVQRRKDRLAELVAEREAIDREITQLGVGGTCTGRKKGIAIKSHASRGRRTKPLGVFVAEALAGMPQGMTIRRIEEAVLAAGYATSCHDLYNPIGLALNKIGARKLSRGVYALPDRKKPKPTSAVEDKGASNT